MLIGTAFGLGLYLSNEKRREESYPLEDEMQSIRREFYRYFLTEGKHPQNLSFLSKKSREIIKIYERQFEWDAEDYSLHLTHLEPVDFRSPLAKLTFGLLGDSSKIMGTIITEENVSHNAQIFKDAGKLD